MTDLTKFDLDADFPASDPSSALELYLRDFCSTQKERDRCLILGDIKISIPHSKLCSLISGALVQHRYYVEHKTELHAEWRREVLKRMEQFPLKRIPFP
jgi:hypothetical protein